MVPQPVAPRPTGCCTGVVPKRCTRWRSASLNAEHLLHESRCIVIPVSPQLRAEHDQLWGQCQPALGRAPSCGVLLREAQQPHDSSGCKVAPMRATRGWLLGSPIKRRGPDGEVSSPAGPQQQCRGPWCDAATVVAQSDLHQGRLHRQPRTSTGNALFLIFGLPVQMANFS